MPIPTLINQYIATSGVDDIASTYISELSQLLLNKSFTLLQFIQYLGPYLTSDDGLIRAKAVQCLSETLPGLELSRQDITVLVGFFLDKLTNSDDKFSLLYILNGLNALVQMRQFNGPEIILKALLNYEPKKSLSKIRYVTFEILVSISKKFSPSEDFIRTFLHLASGEKDPRNLLASFGLNIFITENFIFDNGDLHKTYLDDLFDVCFCYFPISFSPPANDPYKITALDLKLKLRKTISSEKFIKDSIPNLNEKLTLTNPVVRNDVLSTLLEVVDSADINEYWVILWNGLKFEILHNDVLAILSDTLSSDLEDTDDNKSLVLTLEIIGKVSSKLDDTNKENFLTTSLAELKSSIFDKSKQTTLLLAVLLSDLVYTFEKVIEFLFAYDVWGGYFNVEKTQDHDDHEDHLGHAHSHDHGHSHSHGDGEHNHSHGDGNHNHAGHSHGEEVEIDKNSILTVAKQRDLVDNIGVIFSGYKSLYAKLADKSTIQHNHLLDFKNHLLLFFGQLLTSLSNLEKTLKTKIIQVLVKIIDTPEYLDVNDIKLILGYINNLLSVLIDNQEWNDVLFQQITQGLVNILEVNTTTQSLVSEVILTNLLNQLDQAEVDGDIEQFSNLLTLTGKLCINTQILEVLSVRLLSKIERVSREPATPVSNSQFQLIVDNLHKLVLQVQTQKQFLMNSWLKSFIPRFLQSLKRFTPELSVSNRVLLIESSGDLTGLIVRFVNVSKHQQMLNDFTTEFISEKPEYSIGIYNKILANIDKQTAYPIESIYEDLVVIITGLSDDVLRIQYLTTLCLIVNKYEFSSPESFIEKTFNVISEVSLASFEISIWSLKGLLLKLKGKNHYQALISHLFSTTTSSSTKALISNSLRVIFTDLKVFAPSVKGKLVSNVNNINVKILYKQQIFQTILPLLVENFSTSPDLYLNSLSIMIENVSSKILIQNLDQILPLALQGLKVRNSSLILSSSLSTLKVIITENRLVLKKDDNRFLVSNLTQIATTKFKSNTEAIRVLSLECLLQLFGNTGLEEFKKGVLVELRVGLDDKKRSIRKLTSDLRQILYEY